MTHVRLVGSNDDGQSLVVSTDTGEHFSLPVTEELRTALDQARPAMGPEQDALPPKEIQRRIRAGSSAEDLAALTGEDVSRIRRYEGPIVAERAYIAQLARATRIGREASAPILGDLVTDRLAGRGISTGHLRWDAWRPTGGAWQVGVDFPAEGRFVQATWTFDHAARTITANDPESRWLTEVELSDIDAPARHLASVDTPRAPADPAAVSATVTPLRAQAAAPVAPPQEAPRATENLLEQLGAKRGTRESVLDDVDTADDLADDEEFEGFGPVQMREAEVGFAAGRASLGSGAHPAGRSAAEPREARAKRPHRKGRAPLPRWDEIVFGAKSD